jgi:hypothetical protein
MITTKALTWACGLLLAALVALGLAYWLQSVALKSCRVDVERQTVAVERLEAEKVRLLGTIKDQNDAVAKLRDVAGEKAAAAHEALASARAANSKYEASRKRLAALLGSPTPSGAGCREAAEAVRRELRK